MREKQKEKKKNNPAYNVFLLTNQEKAQIFLTLFSIVTRVKDLKKKLKNVPPNWYIAIGWCFTASVTV